MALPARPLTPEVFDPSLVRSHSDTLVPFPERARSPLRLRRLYRGTQGLVLLLSAGTLLFYAGTVLAEMRWQKQYHYLVQLRQQRQELMTVTATLQQHLVQSGGRVAGTVPQTPAQTLFIAPAPLRELRPVRPPQIRSWPLGGY
ncbi:MAG: hypothetical protein Q6J18_01525 [Gloeomargarita sp. DG02_3_bins_56]